VPNQIDLNALGEGSKYALYVESETLEDAAARRQEEAEEARHRRRIQFWTIMLTIVLVLFAVFVSLLHQYNVLHLERAERCSSAAPPLPAFHGVRRGEGVGATALKHLFC
jgi:hypothetical protein